MQDGFPAVQAKTAHGLTATAMANHAALRENRADILLEEIGAVRLRAGLPQSESRKRQ